MDEISKLKKEVEDIKRTLLTHKHTGIDNTFRIDSLANIVSLPNLTVAPTKGEIGQVCVVGGKLYICTATTPTWTLVGSQT